MAIGEQADNLEAIRRTAAYQDRPRHGPFSLFCLAQRRMGALHGRLFPRQGWKPCQISASAAVMAITKWSIPGSEKKPHCVPSAETASQRSGDHFCLEAS
jgi:hypothetical protein